MSLEIAKKIAENEVLVRCLLHPFFANGNKMDRNALLPPPERRDVSTLRLFYTNLDFCKKHAKSLKIGDSTYWGLGFFLNEHIISVNKSSEVEIQANIISTPIDENNQYIIDISNITSDIPGLPMHADLIYDEPAPPRGTVSTKHRKYAQELLKLSKHIKDAAPDSISWEMGNISF